MGQKSEPSNTSHRRLRRWFVMFTPVRYRYRRWSLKSQTVLRRRGQGTISELETGSGNDFRIGKYGQWDPFIHARDLGGLGILDPGLEG